MYIHRGYMKCSSKGKIGDRLTCPHSLTGLMERDASPLCLAVLAKAASPVPTVAATRSLRDTVHHAPKRQCAVAFIIKTRGLLLQNLVTKSIYNTTIAVDVAHAKRMWDYTSNVTL